MPFDPTRLVTQLNNTGLQNKDYPLYQFLKELISGVATISASGGSSTNVTNIINQISGSGSGVPGMDGADGEEGSISAVLNVPVPGATGLTGDQGPPGSPVFIEDGLDGNDGFNIPNPGPAGVTGAQGPAGNFILTDDIFIDDSIIFISQTSIAQILPQAVQAVTTTNTSLTTSFADVTGLSVTITPRSVNSRFRITTNMQVYLGNGLSVAYFRFLRNGASIQEWDDIFNNNANQEGETVTLDYIDSPATVSAITYKVQGKMSNFANVNLSVGGTPSSVIIVQEILG